MRRFFSEKEINVMENLIDIKLYNTLHVHHVLDEKIWRPDFGGELKKKGVVCGQ